MLAPTGVVGGDHDGAAVTGLIRVEGQAADAELLAVAQIDLHDGIAGRRRQHDRAGGLQAVGVERDLAVGIDRGPRRQAVLGAGCGHQQDEQQGEDRERLAHYRAPFG